jgi:hypothetical protein
MDRYVSVPPPTPPEAEALAVVRRYLARAADAAGTRRLAPGLPPGEAALLETLRDQTAAAAALCDVLLELDDGRAARDY